MELCVKLPRMIATMLLGMLLALALPGAAHAQWGAAGTPVEVCALRAAPGMQVRALLGPAARFDCATPQSRFGGGDFWLRSAPLPAGTGVDAPAIVRSASLWQRRATLYGVYGDGRIVALVTDNHAATRHLQLGAIAQRELPPRAAGVTRLLWHVEGSANVRGILIGVRIATPEQAAASNLGMAAFYAAFAGLCIALLVYNAALWGAMRLRFQLIYCAMVAALLLYAFSSSGALAWAFPGIANTDRARINYISLALSAAAALAFARSFFEARVFAGWLGTASTLVTAALLAAASAYAALAPWHILALDRAYSASLLLLMALVPPMLWRAWHERSNYLWVFALAWAAPVVFGGLRIFNGFYPQAWSFWLDNSTILSMTVEALLSSLAIAYRIRLLSLERDEARAEEIAARLLADTDALTGLLNRRAFLRHAIGREGEQLLLIADIDHFKRVNETIGHDGGDEVLRVFARTLRAAVPAEALVARLGGEEFAILTPTSRPVVAEAVLARLRTARMPFDLTVTASLGVCTGTLATEAEWKALYRCSDRALFEAKAAGRDRWRVALRSVA